MHFKYAGSFPASSLFNTQSILFFVTYQREQRTSSLRTICVPGGLLYNARTTPFLPNSFSYSAKTRSQLYFNCISHSFADFFCERVSPSNPTCSRVFSTSILFSGMYFIRIVAGKTRNVWEKMKTEPDGIGQ